jgi:hypothetical protein
VASKSAGAVASELADVVVIGSDLY